MKRKEKQKYITVPYEGAKPEWVKGATTEELFTAYGENIAGRGSAEISYRLATVAEELTKGSPYNHTPTVLLVSSNQTRAKNVIWMARNYRLNIRAAYAGTPTKEPIPQGVCLSETDSPVIFENCYAVFHGAKSCEAKAILLVDSPLSEDQTFLSLAQTHGMQVFKSHTDMVERDSWIICEARVQGHDVVWSKCPNCDLLFDEQSFTVNDHVCPSCSTYLRMTSMQRIDALVDVGSFVEWDATMEIANPLAFPEYPDKLEALQEKTGLDEAVRCGSASIVGLPLALCVMDSQFLMGSMGHVVGEKITRAVERATSEGLPLVIFTASGGARMQEGLVSLMQMAKISCAISKHSEAGLLYISVITDPTTGGVTASFGMQGDIIFAEPNALIGFAGQRVIKGTINQELPEGFQTAEFALQHGLIDGIVDRHEMRSTLAHVLGIHKACSDDSCFEDGEQISYISMTENLYGPEGRYKTTNNLIPSHMQKAFKIVSQKEDESESLFGSFFRRDKKKDQKYIRTQKRLNTLLNGTKESALGEAAVATSEAEIVGTVEEAISAWENVQLARNQKRPTSRHYIDAIVDGFIELHGDRTFGDDQAIICGLGWIGRFPVTIVAQEKGTNVKERVAHNFGCPQPEGYHKSKRIMEQAEKFGRPIVCLVDTPGAHCGIEAEERGQGNAIATNLLSLASLSVPVVSVVIGEGSSGGALALALADRVAMLEHAVYSILSPEGFASILWKDKDRAAEAAAVMKMSAHDVHEMGIIDTVLPEGEEPAHCNPDTTAAYVRSYLVETLGELAEIPSDQLLEERYQRFRKY